MKKQIIFIVGGICLGIYANAAPPMNLIDAIKQNKIEATFTGNKQSDNPKGGSHMGKCLLLNIKNNSATKIDIKIESAYQFVNQTGSHQNLVTTENMIVSIPQNSNKVVSVNALCCEKNDGAPSEKDTFLLIKRYDAVYAKLTDILEKHKCFLNTAQQAMWCFTDNNAIDNIYDTHKDTLVENELVAYVSTAKGVPIPARHRYVDMSKPRILKYPLEVDSSISIHIEQITTIGIYLTDSSYRVLVTLFDEETERRTGTAKYSFFYRGQQYKGTYYVAMKKNGQWVKLKEMKIGE